MRKPKQLDLSESRIWKDKEIKPETKEIYALLYSMGFDKLILNINIGDIQKLKPIKNVGFRNNLKVLEGNKYLIFKEYDKGMYEIHIY